MPPSRRGQRSPEAQRRINHGSAVCVPILVIGFAVYVTWVNVDVVCYQYLLHPGQHFPTYNIPQRNGAAIAILVLHFIFLTMFLLCYGRILQTIFSNPGYIGTGPRQKPQKDMEQVTLAQSCTATSVADGGGETEQSSGFDRTAILSGKTKLPPGAEAIWSKDAFVCEPSGLPNYCVACNVYKPDRSHHSTDVGRCTRRMDHFCPWVGGMVCERNFKFFYQFLVYACCFSVFVLAVMAYAYTDLRHRTGESSGHMIAGIAIGAVFTLFTAGMVGNGGYMISTGVTTVENLDRYRRVYHVAVLMPSAASFNGHIISYPLWAPQGTPTRTFAVMETPQGARPWHLGPRRNWQDLMGHSLLDCLFPFSQSPFCTRDRTSTEYEFGPVLEQMKRSAGFVGSPPQS